MNTLLLGFGLMMGAVSGAAEQTGHRDIEHPGQSIYDYYCYQCHAYNGTGKTLASTYLTPTPRDFTSTNPIVLSRARMLEAVTYGKPGTAMSSFSRVLSTDQISQVVDFVRQTFMANPVQDRRYHTEANGWPAHQRYTAAFQFARGDIPLTTSWDALTAAQREGKRLYLEACVSCHDHASASVAEPVWSPRAVSYPRQYYVYHDAGQLADHHDDEVYPELAFELHEQPPELPDLNTQQRHGEQLYQTHCAFCHAEDGSGLNWIGSFLEPHPPDLNQYLPTTRQAELTKVIAQGIAGTSMPAWRDVLSTAEITAVIAYMRQAFTGSPLATNDAAAGIANEVTPRLQWQRLAK